MLRKLFRTLILTLICIMAFSILLVLIMRWVNLPYSALMLERQLEAYFAGEDYHATRIWQPWHTLPDHLKMAVIAAEDQQFASHYGFDLAAIRAALTYNQQSKSIRGASTISQQVAKNTFLWSSRSWTRKALEAWFTLWIELLWSKERILEVYLNSAEWGAWGFRRSSCGALSFQYRRCLSNQSAGLPACCRLTQSATTQRQPTYFSNPTTGTLDQPASTPARRQPLPQQP